MKKIICITCLVMSILMVSLTSCFSVAERNMYEEQILTIKSNYDKKIISRYGLYYGDEKINYFTLFKNQLKKDNKELNNEASHFFKTGYYQGKVFFSYAYDFGKIMIGYIDSSDYSITNSYVTSEKSGELHLEHINDNYCIYYTTALNNKYAEYYVYDYLSNSIVESGSNSNGIDKSVVNKYKKKVTSNISRSNYVYNGESYKLSTYNGKATIEKDEFNVVINYDYVLNKSAALKEIDKIVGGRKNTIGLDIFAIDEALYVVLYSESTMLGTGVLIPVIFLYDVVADTFEYVGATPYEDILFIE